MGNKTFSLVSIFLLSWACVCAQQRSVSLAGEWTFRIDPTDQGAAEKWFGQRGFTQTLHFPGTLDDRGVGASPVLDTTVLNAQVLQRLARKHRYVGAAWYAKTFTTDTEGLFELQLERVIWRTDCWVDGVYCGFQDRLSCPQRFTLNRLAKGRHTVVLRIDNRKQFEISHENMGIAYTDDTQIIWNGVIGGIDLVRVGSVEVADLQVYAKRGGDAGPGAVRNDGTEMGGEMDSNTIRVNTVIQNNGGVKNGGRNVTGDAERVRELVEVFDRGRLVGSDTVDGVVGDTLTKVTAMVKLAKLVAWDEFNPHLYKVRVRLLDSRTRVMNRSEGDGRSGVLAEKELITGFRTLSNANSQLRVNGRSIFLRGTLDCDIYPLEGHSPMDRAGWATIFRTAKNYGLNHIRFHSWCPPEAAFAVADSMGFYLHIELPLWSLVVGKDKPTLTFLEKEAGAIIRSYGNHPSFCFWSMGNELEGDFNWLNELVSTLKREDPRRLYTSTTFSFQEGHGKWPEPVADYFVTQYTQKGWVRGQGIFNTTAPDFQTDYSASVDGVPVPLIIHEMGQYSVYPDLREIKAYTGVLDPMNLKAIRYDLARKNMLSLDEPFANASGKLAVILYKEEIERALKTPGISGFQLLDLHDFPGQGTALVGLLNAFWKSKGLIAPVGFRMFCSAVVPLIRYKKASYTNDEAFTATAQLANFGNKALVVTPEWSVLDAGGRVLLGGKLKRQRIDVGNGNDLGAFQFGLTQFATAQQLTVRLFVPGTTIQNEWKIWVYPAETQGGAGSLGEMGAAGGAKETQGGADVSGKVQFTTSIDEALRYLANGERVVLNPDTADITGIDGRFAPVFWSPVHFTHQPGTMGLLCDTRHAALRDFPTEQFADWQWWDLVTRSKALIIDSIDYQAQPIVRVIDNFFRNKKLADIIECRVGPGRLILCSMDIHSDLPARPAARQLRYSLLQYAGSDRFNPSTEMEPRTLRRLIHQ